MLRKETSKTGAKVIPLARAALQILEEQRQWASGNQLWVFPGQRGEGHFDSLNKEWERIRRLAGIADVRIHNLRHTYANFGAAGGVGLPLIGGILGPSSGVNHPTLCPPRRHAAASCGECHCRRDRGESVQRRLIEGVEADPTCEFCPNLGPEILVQVRGMATVFFRECT
jgi:hypothetical protein